MTRPLRIAALVVILAGGFLVWRGIPGAAQPPARSFPVVALPATNELAAAGKPIGGLELSSTLAAALFLDGDDRPDLLAISAGGEVQGLLNVAGSRAGAAPFEPGPFTRTLGGAVEDLYVQDLDQDGSHDLAFLVLEEPRSAAPRPKLVLEFAAGGGSFTTGTCIPTLQRVEGRQPVSLGAADADKDGTVDLLLDLAQVREGKVSSVQTPTGDAPTYTITDAAARFPQIPAGARFIADLREGRSFPVLASTPTSITISVAGAPSAVAAGSPYRLILPPDRTVVLRGLGERCFAAGWQIARPVYDVRASEAGKVLVDPLAGLAPANAYRGLLLRYGTPPLAANAATVKIVSQTASELTLDPVAGDLTSKIRGITSGGTPSVYAIIPPTMAPVPAGVRLRNERSMRLLPDDRVSFRVPGSTGLLSGAIADFTGDGRTDLIIASGQLFLHRHR